MHFIADENIPMPSVRLLRAKGFDVTSVLEVAPGIPDEDVLTQAKRLDAVLVTFDSDIGTHVFSKRSARPLGVLYLRYVDSHPEEAAHVILQILAEPSTQLAGHFTTYRNGTVRQRPLASGE